MNQQLKNLAAAADVESRRKAALGLGEEAPGEATPLLDGLLGDPNWRVRKAAVESLLRFPPDSVLPILFTALKDPENAGKRNSALEILSKEGSSILPRIYDHMVDEDKDVKLALITLLGEIPSRHSSPHLIYYLAHEDKNIVSAAITSLGQIRDTSNLPVLMDLFRKRDDWLWFHLIDAFSNIGGQAATEKLSELYGLPKFKKAVLKAFGRMAILEVLPFLLDKAGEGDTPLLNLMDAIGRMYHPNVPAPLLSRHQAEMGEIVRAHFPMELTSTLEGLWKSAKLSERRGLIVTSGFLGDLSLLDLVLWEFENPYLQRDALEAAASYGSAASETIVRRLNRSTALEQKVLLIRLLGVTDGPEAVVPILNQAREEDVRLRMEAISALGKFSDPRCLKELVSILREKDPTFHEAAMRAVRDLAHNNPAVKGEMGEYGRKMVGDDGEGVRRAGYVLLAESLGRETGELLPGLKDPSPGVRRTALKLVAERMGAGAFETLMHMLGDEDSKVRRAVISVLGREMLARQPETLMAALSDSDIWVRAETAFYLAQSAAPGVGRSLLKVLETDELPVRLGALRGLAEVGCGGLFTQIMTMAEDENSPLEVRSAAMTALARSGRPDAFRIIEGALSNGRWEVRCSAVELMGKSGNKRFLPSLLNELETDASPIVRQSVIRALIDLKAAEAVPRMLNYLTDPDLKDQAYSFFISLGKERLRLIENEAQSVDFQTKLILIDIAKHLESL